MSALLLMTFLSSLFPASLSAITSGPAQEEFASFTPASASNMVNLYTGDFSYNIPLLTVPGPGGGYPINLAYSSGSTNINEAGSWVGLNWNLNIGAINRVLRGLPDDFNGEEVKQEMHMRNSFAVSLNMPSRYNEVMGFPVPVGNASPWNGQVYYNNYKGLGFRAGLNVRIGGNNSPIGVGLSFDSQNGIGIDPSISFGSPRAKFNTLNASLQLGASYNSRKGLQALTFSPKISRKSSSFLGNDRNAGVAANLGVGAPITFGFNTALPSIQVPTKTTSIDFEVRIGQVAPFPGSFNVPRLGNWTGNVEWSNLVNGGEDNRAAYGYLFTQNDTNSEGLKDFSRGNNIPYNKKVPNLSPSSYTYDQFSVTGAGVGGMFRPYRAKVEMMNTPVQKSPTTGYKANLEFGGGGGIHIGAGFARTKATSSSGTWDSGVHSNFANPEDLVNNNTQASGADYQDAYFRFFGEQTGRLATDADQLAAWNASAPLRAELEPMSGDGYATSGELVNERNNVTNLNPASIAGANKNVFGVRAKRTPKANAILSLNAQQASSYGFSKDYHYYINESATEDLFGDPADIDDTDKISEIQITKNDGVRYVYGLPAINNTQVDAVFNVYPPYTDFDGNTTNGNSNLDVIRENSRTDSRASDQYSSKTTLPGYAHSWLLTHIVSPDYVDRGDPGFTDDDKGTWMKFEYKKVADDFKWRQPYKYSNFIKGADSNPSDDMAAYNYGTKELYYLARIETATHVALFETSARRDGVGVADELTGGIDNAAGNRMFKLDQVKLFAKPVNGNLPNFDTDAPLQRIVFNYVGYPSDPDNPGSPLVPGTELCPGIPSSSNGGGKLTLAAIYTTAGESDRGRLSPYRFNYGSNNPSFNRLHRDRWGNYQDNSDLMLGSATYPFMDFAYTSQYETPNADAWQLKEITLPTGGVITVEYEPDDYAYEMDKPAVQMFDIIGIGNATFPDSKDRLLAGDDFANLDNDPDANGRYRVYVQLTTPIPGTDKAAYFREHYLGDIKTLYYKTFMQLKDGSTARERDYIEGYVPLLKAPGTYDVSSDGTKAYFSVDEVPTQKSASFGRRFSPFQRAALEHLQANRSELVFGYDRNDSDPGNILDQIGEVVGSIITFVGEIGILLNGFNNEGMRNGWGNKLYLNGRSVVRLQNGTGFMYGGGNRVSKVTLATNWTDGLEAETFGQAYDYSIVENGRTISSGVAITPQGAGGEECALLEPEIYKNSTLLKSPLGLFIEKPFMRAYYPAAGVGYRKVTVKSLADEDIGILPGDITGEFKPGLAPISVHEFYTHKDFPVSETQTDLSPTAPDGILPNWNPLRSLTGKHIGRSQGYTVELNNMAGSQKAVTEHTYPTSDTPDGIEIRKTEYIYHTQEEDATKLSNKVKVVNQNTTGDPELKDGVVGEEYDIFHDFHENAYRSNKVGADLNVEILGIFPVFIPVPTVHKTSTSIRTAVTHKIVYRKGLLKEVKVKDGLAEILTENIAYDPVNAQAILTRTNNEYKDYIYALTEPAYWKYDDPQSGSMAGAYKNLGISFSIDPTGAANPEADGKINLGSIGGLGAANFAVGDEIGVEPLGQKWYVVEVSTTSNTIICQLETGDAVALNTSDGTQELTIVRSGYRNQLIASVANTSFRGQPDPNASSNDVLTQTHFDNRNNNVLNTSAITYKDDYNVKECRTYVDKIQITEECTETAVGLDLIVLMDALANNLFDHFSLPFDRPLTDPPYGLNIFSQEIRDVLNAGDITADYFYDAEIMPGGEINLILSACCANTCPLCDYTYPSCTLSIAPPYMPFDWNWVMGFSDLIPNGNDPFSFYSNATITPPGGATETISLLVTQPESPGCFTIFDCVPTTVAQCEVITRACSATHISTSTNKFASGTDGVWRPFVNYAYKTERQYSEHPVLRDYGSFPPVTAFDWSPNPTNGEEWVMANTATRYSHRGETLEEKDAIGNYSSAQLGYENEMAVAVANNAEYHEIGFDNFEDYPKDCADHFRFRGIGDDLTSGLSTTEAHTGNHSVQVSSGGGIRPYLFERTAPFETSCLNAFYPKTNKKYILSAWVKEKNGINDIREVTTYENAGIQVNTYDSDCDIQLSAETFYGSDKIIDGWQRVFAEFTVPVGANYFEIQLLNTVGAGSTVVAYFDDLRIHPADANMQSYVYDPDTYRLSATLDDNNYATYMIRNQAGQVVKYNAETEKGIVTLKEGMQHVNPN